MNHPTCQKLESYLEGSLDAASVTEFETHLQDCSNCMLEVELGAELEQRIRRQWMKVKAPQHLRSRISSGRQFQTPVDTVVAKTIVGARKNDPKWVLVASISFLLILASLIFVSGGYFKNTKGTLSDRAEPARTKYQPDNASVTEPLPESGDEFRSLVSIYESRVGQGDVLIHQIQTTPSFTIVKAFPTISLNPEKGNNENQPE